MAEIGNVPATDRFQVTGNSGEACGGQTRPDAPHGIEVKDRHRTRIERYRLRITWVITLFWLVAAASVTSRWSADSAVGLSLFAIGCILTGLGIAGRIWCLSYISGFKNTRLMTSGPYALCRHPLYLFSFLATVGAGLGSGTISIPLIATVGFGLYYPGVIRSEEQRLRRCFGRAYESYAQSVPAFVPRLPSHNRGEQHRIEIESGAFAARLTDNLWFLAAFGGLHLLSELHHAGQLASVWMIP